MQNDILAQFRRGNPGATVTADSPEEYCAFGTRDSNHRLRIRGAQYLTHAPGYNLLLDVVYDGQKATHFILVYTILNVLVRGRNLQKMIFAIENGLCDYIQIFDTDRWAMPADKNAAFIESVEFHMKEGGVKDNTSTH